MLPKHLFIYGVGWIHHFADLPDGHAIFSAKQVKICPLTGSRTELHFAISRDREACLISLLSGLPEKEFVSRLLSPSLGVFSRSPTADGSEIVPGPLFTPRLQTFEVEVKIQNAPALFPPNRLFNKDPFCPPIAKTNAEALKTCVYSPLFGYVVGPGMNEMGSEAYIVHTFSWDPTLSKDFRRKVLTEVSGRVTPTFPRRSRIITLEGTWTFGNGQPIVFSAEFEPFFVET